MSYEVIALPADRVWLALASRYGSKRWPAQYVGEMPLWSAKYVADAKRPCGEHPAQRSR